MKMETGGKLFKESGGVAQRNPFLLEPIPESVLTTFRATRLLCLPIGVSLSNNEMEFKFKISTQAFSFMVLLVQYIPFISFKSLPCSRYCEISINSGF